MTRYYLIGGGAGDSDLRATQRHGCGAFDKAVSCESLAFAADAATHMLIGFLIAFFLTMTHSDRFVK